MFTYLATYRLAPGDDAPGQLAPLPPASVTVHIRDFALHHAAARAEWRRQSVAAAQGWHPGRTELVSVVLEGAPQISSSDAPCLPPANHQTRALSLARAITGCDEDASRLVAAATLVATAHP